MTEAIELHDSDVAAVEIVEGAVRIEFSDAYIWAEDKGWGQQTLLILENGQVQETPSGFPAAISEGMLRGTKAAFENIVPLPFSEQGIFSIEFAFSSGESLNGNW